jgi:hypothetical protein
LRLSSHRLKTECNSIYIVIWQCNNHAETCTLYLTRANETGSGIECVITP